MRLRATCLLCSDEALSFYGAAVVGLIGVEVSTCNGEVVCLDDPQVSYCVVCREVECLYLRKGLCAGDFWSEELLDLKPRRVI